MLLKVAAKIASLSPALVWRMRHYKHFRTSINLNGPWETIPDLWTYVVRASIANRANKRWALLADKYGVRAEAARLVGEDFLIPLLGHWERPEDIDFDSLPDSFVLKTNNGCGTNIFVHGKDSLDRADAVARLRKDLAFPYPELSGQLHYSLIPPCVIAERLMVQDGGASSLTDYKIHCVNGEPRIIYVFSDRDEVHHFDFNLKCYTPRWQEIGHYQSVESVRDDAPAANAPAVLEKMLDAARRLSKGEEYVRVDFYIIDGHVYLGEVTLTPDVGAHPAFKPYMQVMGYILDCIKDERRKGISDRTF